jgi:hypothetical protein
VSCERRLPLLDVGYAHTNAKSVGTVYLNGKETG